MGKFSKFVFLLRLCPHGPDSYCFYNKALAKGEAPPSHSTMNFSFTLEPEYKRHVLSVYVDLTRDGLLQRCLKDRTQNPNESFHSKIWNNLSKNKFVSLPTAMYSITLNVLKHNNGYARTAQLMNDQITRSKKRSLEYMDKERQRYSLTPARKKKRVEEEPDTAEYGAGMF